MFKDGRFSSPVKLNRNKWAYRWVDEIAILNLLECLRRNGHDSFTQLKTFPNLRTLAMICYFFDRSHCLRLPYDKMRQRPDSNIPWKKEGVLRTVKALWGISHRAADSIQRCAGCIAKTPLGGRGGSTWVSPCCAGGPGQTSCEACGRRPRSEAHSEAASSQLPKCWFFFRERDTSHRPESCSHSDSHSWLEQAGPCAFRVLSQHALSHRLLPETCTLTADLYTLHTRYHYSSHGKTHFVHT